MPRRLLVISTWAVGTVLATVVAFQAVSLVGEGVTDAHGTTLSQRDVLEQTSPASRGPATATTASTLPSSTQVPTTAVTAPPAPAPSRPSGSSGPGTTATPTTRNGDPTPTVSPSTTAPGPTSTFDLQGGTIGVRCAGTSIQLMWASPKSGFSVDVNKSGPDEIDVRFESGSHRSEIRADCRPGHVEVTEQREESR